MPRESGTHNNQSADVEDLSPSAKLVFKTLEYEGQLTQKQLAKETSLVRRTVRSALRQLEKTGEISSRVKFGDARQDIYWIDDSQEEIVD